LSHFTPSDFGAIVGAAALAHDVGNPPFGHSGESAISDYFKFNPKANKIKKVVSVAELEDLTHFEGNAQVFRLLTRNQRQGLKLTMATLSDFTKYPCPSLFDSRDKSKKSQKKFGYFQAEHSHFEELANEIGLIQSDSEKVWCRHPLTFLVEAADDICYNIIDLEDAFGLGLVSYEEVRDFLVAILKDRYQPDKLEKIPSFKEKIGVLRAVAINLLIDQCTKTFMVNEAQMLEGKFDKALTDYIPATPTMEAISTFSIKRIYQNRQVIEREATGFEVINGLLEAFVGATFDKYYDKDNYSGRGKSIFLLLTEEIVYLLDHEANTPYESIMLITDFISGMTDSAALKKFQIIKGINLS
jgi:dGTPase